MAKVRAILWDLGRTLVDWEPRRLYAKLLPSDDAVEEFLGGVCTTAWHSRHDAGLAMADNRAELIEAHPAYESHIIAWETRWEEMFDGYVEGMDRLFLETIDLGLRPYALTNLPAEKWAPLRAMYPLLTRFEDAIVSGEEGRIKPDPLLFELAKSRLEVPAGETVFIDDSEQNVEAGRAAGFIAVQFTGAPALRRDLSQLGIDIAAG